MAIRAGNAPLDPIGRGEIRVFFGNKACKVNDDLGLFPGRIILHLAVNHRNARTVRHGFEDAAGEFHFVDIWREDAFCNLYLRMGAGSMYQRTPSGKHYGIAAHRPPCQQCHRTVHRRVLRPATAQASIILAIV